MKIPGTFFNFRVRNEVGKLPDRVLVSSPMSWHRPVTLFVLFNLIAAPVIGRLTWMAMLRLAEDLRLWSIVISVVVPFTILTVNAWLTVRASRGGVPGKGRAAMWILTGATFALTIGTGFFSPVSLIHALLTA